jgi:Cytochrome c554 and c-prime
MKNGLCIGILAFLFLPALRAAEGNAPPQYNGPGACSSPACHGSVTPLPPSAGDKNPVLRNEYTTWVTRDKHSHAYTNLTNMVGTRIAKIMELPSPDKAPRCLACHAIDVPEDQRARTFDVSDGVGCENCHNQASAWLGPHTQTGWDYDQSVKLGMYPTRDLIKRSERCLTCHLGTADKTVDHELIAAGHPDLYFELNSFMSVMPAHWQETDTDPWFGVRVMAVGQAVQLREQLRRVARESQNGIWPEYAELDCFACHHNLVAAKDSWRQERGYPDRRPGNAAFNLSRFVVLRHVVQDADPAAMNDLKAGVDRVYADVTRLNSNRLEVSSEAAATAGIAERVANSLNTLRFDQAQTMRLLKSISGDADIAQQGERPAEQATMALDALYFAYTKNNQLANDAQIRDAIKAMFRQLDDPSAYDGFKFAMAMQTLNALFP